MFAQEFLFLFCLFLAFSFHNFWFLLESEPMEIAKMVGPLQKHVHAEIAGSQKQLLEYEVVVQL